VKRSAAMRQFKKTEVCRYAQQGCKHGSACKFAHSLDELSFRPDLSKTSVCRLWRSGRCPYEASQCKFAHGRRELRATAEYYSSMEEIRAEHSLLQHQPQQEQGQEQEQRKHQQQCQQIQGKYEQETLDEEHRHQQRRECLRPSQLPTSQRRQVDLQIFAASRADGGSPSLGKDALQMEQFDTDCGSDSGVTCSSLEDTGVNWSRSSSQFGDNLVMPHLALRLHSGNSALPDVALTIPIATFHDALPYPNGWSNATVVRLLAAAAPDHYED